jgi:hypothetical protein
MWRSTWCELNQLFRHDVVFAHDAPRRPNLGSQLQALSGLRFSLGNFWSLLAALCFAWFSIRLRDWTRTIAPLPLVVVTAARCDPIWDRPFSF